MKLLWIGGSHPRHLYYINEIANQFDVAGAIIQRRGGMLPQPPDVSRRLVKLWERHFRERDEAEFVYFGGQQYPDTDVLEVSKEDLESTEAVEMVKRIKPDVVLIFGCGMIRGELANVLPEMSLNLHLGISPRYRGAATLFWPFYFLEPQWAGCTIHKIVHEPDAGDILHQCVPDLHSEDGIHDVSCRAVVQATADMKRILNNYPDWKFRRQTSTGKNFLESDFKPQHLEMIYTVFNNNIAKKYLDGFIEGKEPKLWSAL